MILYHGSNTEIDKIDLIKCRPYKDFGCGFYTTPLKDQALSMAIRTTRIFMNGKPCITEFSCDDNFAEAFKVKRFSEPGIEWAKFVINNRNHKFTDIHNSECNTDGKYDIVIGPVANDDITALVDVYLSGILSDEVLAKELTFRDLSMQISFHSVKAINCLKKTGVFYA